MKKPFILLPILILLSALLWKCSILDTPEYMHNLWASIDSVEVKAVENGEVTFNCLTSVGDPCHYFDRLEVNRNADTIYIRIYSKRVNKTCTTEVVTKEFEIKVDAQRNKTNYFKFWQVDNYSKDLELYVP